VKNKPVMTVTKLQKKLISRISEINDSKKLQYLGSAEKPYFLYFQVKRVIFEKPSARKNGKYPKKACISPNFC
jgi:hypothetical protein